MAKKKSESIKLLYQELNGNPYRRLNLAFILISVIPILTFAYLLIEKIFTDDKGLAGMKPIIFFACAILALGYAVAYGVIKNVINMALSYAAKAKRADELKSTFAMSLAHDLKSPLMTIKANISNLKSGFLGALTLGQDEAIGVCREVSDRMSAIITELIDIYMVEAQMVELKRARFDMRELIEEQRRELEPLGLARSIALKVELPEKPLMLDADKDKMLRVINNLLGNAIKFAPENGWVTVRAYPAEGFARLEVTNNGAPIPEDSLERIFDKFERLDKSIEGHGLGLAIARDIVELHQGKIWVTSGSGRETCFTMVIALAQE